VTAPCIDCGAPAQASHDGQAFARCLPCAEAWEAEQEERPAPVEKTADQQ